MLSLIAWTLTRAEASTLALAVVFAETAVTQDTTIAWSIVWALASGALGVGITVGIFKNKVATLAQTIEDLKQVVIKVETQLRGEIVTEESTRQEEAKSCTAFQANARERLATIESDVKHLQKRPQSNSPRSRNHEQTDPRR